MNRQHPSGSRALRARRLHRGHHRAHAVRAPSSPGCRLSPPRPPAGGRPPAIPALPESSLCGHVCQTKRGRVWRRRPQAHLGAALPRPRRRSPSRQPPGRAPRSIVRRERARCVPGRGRVSSAGPGGGVAAASRLRPPSPPPVTPRAGLQPRLRAPAAGSPPARTPPAPSRRSPARPRDSCQLSPPGPSSRPLLPRPPAGLRPSPRLGACCPRGQPPSVPLPTDSSARVRRAECRRLQPPTRYA